MALTPEQRQYVIRAVTRILCDSNRKEIIAALKQDILDTHDDDEAEPDDRELDIVVLAVAEACKQRLGR